ncbi:MAG TPA: acetoacetate--CoA ligase [Steroidobacteraceae bacterium]|nr:acetoacetate--CoA ligase [Steroidobacteraceae bacterium]
MVKEGDLLWTPSEEWVRRSNLTAYMGWLARNRKLSFETYDELWRWSVDDLEGFWASIWDYCAIQSSEPYQRVLGRREMPGAEWFPGARLNYAEHALRYERPGADAIYHLSERIPLSRISWQELGAAVRVLATQLRKIGIRPGDRVAGYLPNTPHALIALLATASIGAIWTSCGPEFGTRGVLDRFTQLGPKLLFCVDGYQYASRPFDRRGELTKIIGALDSLEHVVCVPYLNPEERAPFSKHTLFWDDLLKHPAVPASEFRFEQVAFGHPLWILFSSGTTGLPKAIVHSHGGILIEQMKAINFQMDMRPGERLFFYTTTGWMMWNFLVSCLVVNVCPVLYDGSLMHPEPDSLWRMYEESGATMIGANPGYVALLEKSGVVPREKFEFPHLRSVMLAGSPVTPEVMAWFYQNVKRDLWVQNGSGGTDICSAFVAGVPILPVRAGEIQARMLGVEAHAFNERGEAVVNEVGELVITKPMPSMPVFLWNDPHFERYRDSYFAEFPGVWRQGDFFRINERGSSFVLGRSDATLNRHGVRIGTAEIYRSLALIPEVEDSLIVNLDLPGGRFFMPLFVKLREGVALDRTIEDKMRSKLRVEYSPRHVPDRIYQVPDIPYTLTGKKMEVPVRRILAGVPLAKAANRDAVANPHALDYFVEYAKMQQDYSMAPSS